MSPSFAQRTLHLMDIENLLGNARPSEQLMHDTWDYYLDLVDLSEPIQVVIACNHGAACVVGCCVSDCEVVSSRLLVRSGRNGADEALLDVLSNENVANRFTHVVLASGDGIFTERVAQLTSAGLVVTVIARPSSLSNRLKMAASKVIYFEPDVNEDFEMAVAA